MSRPCGVLALTVSQMETLEENPELLERLPELRLGLFDEEDEEIDWASVFDEPLQDVLDLGGSWALLRFLFFKFEVPDGPYPAANELIAYRDDVDAEAFGRFLQSIDSDKLLSRVDYRELRAEVIYGKPPRDDQEDYEEWVHNVVVRDFPLLRAYVVNAVAAGKGVYVWVDE